MRPVSVDAKLAVYEKYKEDLLSSNHTASVDIRKKLEENHKNILEKIDSDADLLRKLTIDIRRHLNVRVIQDLKKIKSPRFSSRKDAADTTRVYKWRIKIPEIVQIRLEKTSVNPNVLTKKELQDLLQIAVLESFNQSGKTRAGKATEIRVRHELTENGWNIVKRNLRRGRIDVDIMAKYKGTDSEEEIKIGVSCKRTARERWRQNITDQFDVFLHASLGSDLPLETIKDYPNNIHIVPDDAKLTEEEEKSNQVQRISWVTPANIKKFIAQLSI
tara:strand:- start:58 stop:879 length:822 start_codon:yes stop_codon:yes gene_type:complete